MMVVNRENFNKKSHNLKLDTPINFEYSNRPF